jgi:hypothetical protein
MSVDREAPDVSPALAQLGPAMPGTSRGESPRLTGITNFKTKMKIINWVSFVLAQRFKNFWAQKIKVFHLKYSFVHHVCLSLDPDARGSRKTRPRYSYAPDLLYFRSFSQEVN